VTELEDRKEKNKPKNGMERLKAAIDRLTPPVSVSGPHPKREDGLDPWIDYRLAQIESRLNWLTRAVLLIGVALALLILGVDKSQVLELFLLAG